MDVELEIHESESILKKIKQFDPDPYYVNYFFNSYLFLVNKVYSGIFEEANRDFGLFITKYTKEAFLEKANKKNDQKAVSFVTWFEKNMMSIIKVLIQILLKNAVNFKMIVKNYQKLRL